jgi:hypothetical protein
MSVVWKLEYNGETRPLAQWGLDNAVLDFGNQVRDTLTLRVAGEGATAAPRFAFEGKVVLWRDNVRWFTGWIATQPKIEGASGARRDYVAAGPWYWLETIIYQQPHWVLVDPNAEALGYASLFVSKLVLFQSATGASSDAGEQAQDVVDYAIFKTTQYNNGEPLFARADFTDLVANAPWERGLDLNCAETLRRCVRWIRDAVAYWDYTPEIPVLHIERRASLTPAVIDLDNDGIVGECAAGPRYDLVPRGVLLRFQRTITNPETGNQWTEFVTQTAGTADGGPRCISATLSLAGSGDGAEPVPSNLATDYYNSLATLPWEGSIVLREADPTGLLAVGNVLNIEGGETEWETMAAVIQSVKIDIVGRTTQARFGPADQLGPQEFLDQVRFQRGEPAGGGAGGRFDGTPENPQPPSQNPPSPPGGPPGGPSGPPTRERKIKLCDEEGNEEEFVIRGYKSNLQG